MKGVSIQGKQRAPTIKFKIVMNEAFSNG